MSQQKNLLMIFITIFISLECTKLGLLPKISQTLTCLSAEAVTRHPLIWLLRSRPAGIGKNRRYHLIIVECTKQYHLGDIGQTFRNFDQTKKKRSIFGKIFCFKKRKKYANNLKLLHRGP